MLSLAVVGLACSLALVSLGGALYEFRVVDPSWPQRPDLIQPMRGGISRRRFWIPTHIAFEWMLLAALVLSWSRDDIRNALLVALTSHSIMRVWSALDFIPKALAFERAEPAAITGHAAQAWIRRSLWRLPLDLVTCTAMLAALVAAARLA